MKFYIALSFVVLLVGTLCVVLAAPGSLVSSDVANANGIAPAEPELYFPPYSIDPPRIVNGFPNDASESSASSDSSESSDSSASSDSSESSDSSASSDSSESSGSSASSNSSESLSEEDDESIRPEGRTFFLIFRLLQLLSQQNSTSSG